MKHHFIFKTIYREIILIQQHSKRFFEKVSNVKSIREQRTNK